jgi:hypothetical protein
MAGFPRPSRTVSYTRNRDSCSRKTIEFNALPELFRVALKFQIATLDKVPYFSSLVLVSTLLMTAAQPYTCVGTVFSPSSGYPYLRLLLQFPELSNFKPVASAAQVGLAI